MDNKETGEITSNYMSIAALDKYKEEHPDWNDTLAIKMLPLYMENQNSPMDLSKWCKKSSLPILVQTLADLLDYAAKKAKDTCSLWYDSETDWDEKNQSIWITSRWSNLSLIIRRECSHHMLKAKHLVLHGALVLVRHSSVCILH